jgi:hypothetical protein
MNVDIQPTGTIEYRQTQQGTNGNKSIYQQMDFTDEGNIRLTDMWFEDQLQEEQLQKELSEVEAECAVASNKITPQETTTDQTMETAYINPSGWYAECDVCYENDAGTSQCNCRQYIHNCSFTSFELFTNDRGFNVVLPHQVECPVLIMDP